MPVRSTANVFQALGDPTRRAVLKVLRRGSRSAGEIASTFDLSKPTLSHHFRVLVSAGLVRRERRGTTIVYTLQSSVLEDVAAELLDLATSAGGPARRTQGSPA
jgi:DNA-binding transcriptional ArsR family regulator